MSAGDSGLTDALAYLGGFGTSLELQQCLRASVATWGLHNPKVILEHPESFPSFQQLRGQSLAIRYTKLIMDGGDNGDEILLKMFALASGSFIRIFDFSPRSPTGGGARIMLPTSPVVRASGTWSRSIPLGALVKYRTGSSPRTVTWRVVFHSRWEDLTSLQLSLLFQRQTKNSFLFLFFLQFSFFSLF